MSEARGRAGDPIEQITATGVVPVVTMADATRAAPVADALAAGGLSVIEVTLRTEAGLDAIRELSTGDRPALVGALSLIHI